MGVVIASFALAHLIAGCAPHVGPVTMTAIVYHESGGRTLAIGDDTTRRSYVPNSIEEAELLARRLLASGHSIDVGLAQINSVNFPAYGLDVASAFEPCTNVRVASRILRKAYAAARGTFGCGTAALVHALSVYNSGGYWAGLTYARAVYATAASLRHDAPGR